MKAVADGKVQGGCACGRVAIIANSTALACSHCHCASCRRWQCSAFSTWVAFNLKDVAIDGKLALKAVESSAGVLRDFCSHCGSPMFYRSSSEPDAIYVTRGVFPESAEFRPSRHVSFEERVAWFACNDDLPKHRGKGHRMTSQVDKDEPQDKRMVSHLSVTVKNLQRSIEFYDAALGTLGYVRVWTSDDAAGYGMPGNPNEPFAIKSDPNTPRQVGNSRSHIAFSAATREAVAAFHRAALSAGGDDNGAPGLRPHYGEGYFAAFVIDPDGTRLEAVSAT